MVNQTSPRKDLLNKPLPDVQSSDSEPAEIIDYATLGSSQKPGVDGLPMVTLLGAIVVGIIMWAGIFALIGAIINAL
ncbi:MAG: hypothetical protein RLP44_28980 [Aggregatilineales bacterium]